jgi:hypothetical protein
MKHCDFAIGEEFYTARGRWRCTDIGRRVVTAVRLLGYGPPCPNCPPYVVKEHVFNERDMAGCFGTADESGYGFDHRVVSHDNVQFCVFCKGSGAALREPCKPPEVTGSVNFTHRPSPR